MSEQSEVFALQRVSDAISKIQADATIEGERIEAQRKADPKWQRLYADPEYQIVVAEGQRIIDTCADEAEQRAKLMAPFKKLEAMMNDYGVSNATDDSPGSIIGFIDLARVSINIADPAGLEQTARDRAAALYAANPCALPTIPLPRIPTDPVGSLIDLRDWCVRAMFTPKAGIQLAVSNTTQPEKTIVLFLAANPDGTDTLALDKEYRAISEKIRASGNPQALDLKSEWAVRPGDLLQYLNEHHPHVVHFSGHGSARAELILHDHADQPTPISKAALQALFTTLKDNIRIVVLNACYSRPQAQAIVEIIDCAVGMRGDIGDDAATVFAASFYSALGFGHSVKQAFDEGRTALLLQNILEENTPELLVKQGVDAAQVYLVGRSI